MTAAQRLGSGGERTAGTASLSAAVASTHGSVAGRMRAARFGFGRVKCSRRTRFFFAAESVVCRWLVQENVVARGAMRVVSDFRGFVQSRLHNLTTLQAVEAQFQRPTSAMTTHLRYTAWGRHTLRPSRTSLLRWRAMTNTTTEGLDVDGRKASRLATESTAPEWGQASRTDQTVGGSRRAREVRRIPPGVRSMPKTAQTLPQ